MSGRVRTGWSGTGWSGRVLLVVVVLVALVGVAWVQRLGDDTRTALADAYAASLSEDRAAEAAVSVALQYVSPALWRADLPRETEESLWQVVREQADAAAARMSEVRARIDDITVLPWRADQQRAREALLDFVTAQEDRFLSMAQDVRATASYLSRGPVSNADTAQALWSIGAPIR